MHLGMHVPLRSITVHELSSSREETLVFPHNSREAMSYITIHELSSNREETVVFPHSSREETLVFPPFS
jgi:hypothetical protein